MPRMLEDGFGPRRNANYRAQFDSLSENTTEYGEMLRYFETEVFPNLVDMGHFLDIGAGRGNYARPLASRFERTTVVEPNELFYRDMKAWAEEAGVRLSAFNAAWQDVDWKAHDADLTVISHVLYYVPKESRSDFIRKAYDTLKPGGTLLIVLNSELCGIREVYRTFYPREIFDDMPYGEEVGAMLRAEGYPAVQERVFPATISLSSREAALQLVDFLLLRRVPFDDEDSRRRLDEFVDGQMLANGTYRMDSCGTIVRTRRT